MSKPKGRTTAAMLDELAARQPGHEAVVDGDRRWSYGRLNDEVRRVARGLWSLGVRRGDRVAILMGNNAEWVASYFAVAGLGAATVALNTWLTRRELAYQLDHARVGVLILEPGFRDRDFLADVAAIRAEGGLAALRHVVVVGRPGRDGMAFEAMVAGGAAQEPAFAAAWPACQPADVACILYTSGSTAAPKGVPLQHRGLIDNAWEIGERMHVTPADRLWAAVSLFWSFGCVNALFNVMSHGATVVLQHHFDAGEALRLIEQERCTVFYGTPNVALALTEHPDRAKHDLSSLRTGATIGTPEQIRQIVDLGAHEICNVYGLTEAFGNSCVADCKAPLEQRLVASGAPLAGVTLRILDLETGRPLPPGEVGEIALKGRLMPGYLDAPEQTAASMTADGFLLTGDIGLLDEHGWVRFRGRRKEIIKTGGINVSPAEIEEVLRGHPSVEACYVTGVADARLDETVSAVVILKPGAAATPEQLQQHCRVSLSAYKVPRRFRFATPAELPHTSTGKLQRNRLPELFRSQPPE